LGCTLLDADNNVIDCNLEALKLFEIQSKQEFCERFSELSPEYQPDGRLSVEKRLEYVVAALETGYQRLEWMHQTIDGMPMLCEVTLVRVKKGNTFIIAGYTRDLREEKKMFAEMHKADERSHIMLDTAPLACTIIDQDRNVIDCNTGAHKHFDISSKQEFCSRFFELSPEYQPDGQLTMEKFCKVLAQVFETGYVRSEWMHQKFDGTPVPCEVTAVRVQWADSYVAVCYARDLREEKKMLAEIHEANERIHTMLDATPIGCSVWDEKLSHVECNLAMVKLFEMSSKQEFLTRFFELSPECQPNGQLSAELVKKNLITTFETGYARFEQVHQLLDGTPVPCEVTLVRVPHGDGYNICGYMRDLREEKRMLAEMREADERVQIMLDATPLCATLWDDQLHPLDCNMAAVKLFGARDKQEYLDRFFESFPEYQPNGQLSTESVHEKIMAAFETGYQRFECMHQKLDGTPIPAEVTIVRVQRGNTYIVVGYARDLLEEKTMLAERHAAEERASIMLDTTPMACALFDMTGKIIDCNEESIRLSHLKDKQEFCERFFELSPEYQPNGQLSQEMRREKFMAAVQSGYQRYEWTYLESDGSLVPCEVTLVRVKQNDDFIIAGYGRDLREIKKHEAKQKRDRRLTNALLELAQMPQHASDEITDYVIKSITSLTESTIGYVVQLEHAADELPFRSLVVDQFVVCSLPTKTEYGTPHTLSTALTKCLVTKKAVVHDDFMALPGTRNFPAGHCEVRSHMNVPIMDDNTPVGILGVGNKEIPYTETDAKQLTLLAQGLGTLLNRKKHAENLEKAKVDAENANKAKSEFLAHMSHEIRTPLNGVIGLSDLLSGTPLNEKQREYVHLINASGNALLFLINDILDFSKIEAGKLEIDNEPFDLAATIGTVLASLVPRAADKKLELAVSLCRELPRIVEGDSGRIRQILINLIGNAVKFTDHGGVRLDVVIESMGETFLIIKFSVIDTGIGIPQSKIDRLFKAFSQVDASSARIYGGTGLGLAISMQLVRLMKGEIGVESADGKGSTFWFKIPFGCDPEVFLCLHEDRCTRDLSRHCPNVDGQYCTLFVNREVPSEYCIKGHSVLVVDDNEVQRDALRIQLENWGMECTTCDSGVEALRLAKDYHHRQKPFDLFVIDSTLSDGAGIDLARRLFEQEIRDGVQAAQIILLRSLSDDFEHDVIDDYRAEYVGKPVFASALFDAVINRVFAAKRKKKCDSGIITPSGLNVRLEKPKLRWQAETARQTLSPANRLKSHLAGQVHVLVVEDNRVNQIVAKNLLMEAGFTCDIAQNGTEACSAIRNDQYDVVLMDCQMPEMDGYEATILIRNWEREYGRQRLPIIALTANATKNDVQKCFDAGMDAYCSKPINPLVVLRLIEDWYEKKKDMSGRV